MQKIIEFEDKVALNENSSIPEINKITDDNINEIKSIVNKSLQGTNAMGSIVVDNISCKNIANNLINSQTINGVTITKNNNGTLTLNGTSTQEFVLTIDTLDLKAGTTYTMSGVENASDSFATFDMRISSGGNIYNDWVLPTKPTYMITSDVTLYFSMRVGNGAAFNNTILYPMVEIGDEATTYTPHKEFENKEIHLTDIYSTNETITNKVWIDGKPIYRKVCVLNVAGHSSTWTTFSFATLGLNNIDYIYMADGTRNLDSGIQIRDINYNRNIYIATNTYTLEVGPYSNATVLTIVFEYTKTTDTGNRNIISILDDKSSK